MLEELHIPNSFFRCKNTKKSKTSNSKSPRPHKKKRGAANEDVTESEEPLVGADVAEIFDAQAAVQS